MNDPLFNKLRETSWKRTLTPDEEAALRSWLAAHPDAGADWETEASLNGAIHGIPDVPVPTNFTARVLQTVERDSRARPSRGSGRWWQRVFLPRTAIAATLVGLGLIVYQQNLESRRVEMGRQVAAVSSVAALSAPDLLLNLETIRQLSAADISAAAELIALLTQPQ
jgi:anti-sigma factor RsiW